MFLQRGVGHLSTLSTLSTISNDNKELKNLFYKIFFYAIMKQNNKCNYYMGDGEIMNKIKLNSEGISDITIVPNTFIELFMPSANGSYVKVYLYLLKCIQGNCPNITISSIADHLENTENDILRALNYWDKLGALNLAYNEQKDITSIKLTSLDSLKTVIM